VGKSSSAWVRVKLLSGAGYGTGALVLKLLLTPAVAYIGGIRKEFPLSTGLRIPFWEWNERKVVGCQQQTQLLD
jgi:hypothetical protein